MAHGLRYYKELTHADGKVVRLELLQKDYAGASMEIGPVCQALRLDIQGDTEIDAPIIKTSLSMTFVDAPDHVDAKTKKCGNWTEFYTNDATYWQVVVKAKNAGETDFRRVWGGYVTPDSYNEVLVYRGSVTIVARDNIGHLSDFPFDAVGNADGMITLIELIREAWDKIESPMWLDDQAVANADWLMSEGAYAYDTYMNVSAFESKNWYDALESALYAYGLVMRYTGWNNVSFYSLRNMPRMGAYEVDDIDYREPVFEAGAERELTPAVKRIEEAVEYKLTDSKSAPMAKSIKFTGATSSIPYKYRNSLGETSTKNADVWPIVNTSGFGWGNGNDSPPLYFNPSAYPCEQSIKDDAQSSIYLATNTDQSGASWYAQMFKGKRFSFTLSFGRLIMRDISIASKPTVFPIMLSSLTVKKVMVSIAATSNGVTSYLNEEGKWQTDGVILEVPIDEETMQASKTVFLDSFAQVTSLVLIGIHDITLGGREGQDWYDPSKGGGVYVAVKSLSFAEVQGDALCETNRVNTNYDATNNVILSREPKIAPALNDVLFPSIIKNGIFVKVGNTYHPAKLWNWGGQTPQQMAVYNHLQLLCYHAKPNNVLRGTIVNADVTDMQVIWMWHGAEHMFVSGSFNLLSGHIENAVLREFARYEDMWGLLDPADLPDVDGSSVTNIESGSASKNEGARNTINTEVYLGGGNIVLDDYMSAESENGVMNRVIKAYVDDVRTDLTDLWHLDENGNLVTDKQVIIKNNLIIDGDTSSGGEGEDTPSGGISGVKVNGVTYYDDNGDGVIDLGTISGGGGTVDLSNYYTKGEADARYLASSLLGSNTLIHSGNIGSYKAGGLATPRTIWGQSFDGTGDVLAMNGVGLMSSKSYYYGLSILPMGSPYWGVRTFLTYDQGSTMGAYEIASRNAYGLTISHSGGVAYDFGNIPSDLSYDVLVNIRPNGNVGIGTTSPACKLDVNGEVRATTFRFYDDYRSRITLNGPYIDIISAGNEMVIGTHSGDTTMYINYRNSTGGGTAKTYIWNAGSPSSWADFYMGNTTINGNLVVSGDVASA